MNRSKQLNLWEDQSHPLTRLPCWLIWDSRLPRPVRPSGKRYVIFLSPYSRLFTRRFLQSGNAERAVEWLFNHPDDTGEDAAAPTASSPAAAAIPGSKAVPARFKLKAFISHKGPSVHSGHYVAHIRVNGQWLLFNDEKVVKADDESVKELKKLAYLYFLEKV